MQKQCSQLCCLHSVHRVSVSAHDAACMYLWSSVHTGGPSSKTLTRIDVMYVACCVSLPEILDMTHCRVHAVLCYSRKATVSYVNCLHAMAQSFGIENRLGRPVWSTMHYPGNDRISSSHVGACVEPASTWGIL